MAKQIINIGSGPNTKTGDPLRTSFTKINENFTELYTATSDDIQIPSQTGNSGKYLTTNGTALSWGTVSASSTGDWTWPDEGGGTQALLGGESGSYIDGQSPGGLLIHNDNIVTMQAGDKGVSYSDTGVLQFQEGSTISETATTLILTPPTALAGQGLVIRTTVGGGLSTIDTFTPGGSVTVTFTDNGSHLSSGGYVDDSESNTWAYTITGISEADLGSPLTGSFLAEDWGVPNINQNVITFNIPAESEGTGFTITLDKIITDPPYYLEGIGGIDEDGRIALTVGTAEVDPEISHVHLTTEDPTTVDLYLGDDDQYVKIEKNGGDVVIGTDANTKRWKFGTNGLTTFPTLSTNLHNGGVQAAQTLQFGNPNLQAVITGPTPDSDINAQRLIIQGQRGLGTGEGGDVYLWAGDAEGINGGDIKIYAGDADDAADGYGGYVNIDGGYGFTQGGNVNISAGYSNTSGGNLSISAGSGPTSGGNVSISAGSSATLNGDVQVSTYGHQWTFNSSGALTFPDTTTQTTAYTGLIANGTKASNATGTAGQISYDADYVYICTATDTWSRAALTGGY